MADDIGAIRSGASKPDIFSSGQRDLLNDNLDPKNVKSRQQPGGPRLSYIEGWHAINEANRIFGFGAWERELVRLERTNCDLVDVTKNGRTEKQWRVGYIATVRVTVHGESGSRHRDGTGFGSGFAKDNALGDAIESAAKEAETDAMKRALSTFGNQFGLALYDKAKANVGPSQLEDDPAPVPTPPTRRGKTAAPTDAGQHETQSEPPPSLKHSFNVTGYDDGNGPGKSAHQAKKDGDWERVRERLLEEMGEQATRAECEAWWKRLVKEDAEYQALPKSFRQMLYETDYLPHLEDLPEVVG